MQAFWGDPGQSDHFDVSTGATTDNAELIARLRARKQYYLVPSGSGWYLSSDPDKDCADAADALAKADERIAELDKQRHDLFSEKLKLETAVDKQHAALVELRNQITQLAREAGEAKGKLEISEAAGIVEGWRERAEAAESKVADQDIVIQALKNQISSEADAKAKVQTYRVAAEARAAALESDIFFLYKYAREPGRNLTHVIRALAVKVAALVQSEEFKP